MGACRRAFAIRRGRAYRRGSRCDAQVPERSALQKALDTVFKAEPLEAVQKYGAVMDLYVRHTTPIEEFPKEIDAVVEKLPFRTMTVAQRLAHLTYK